MILYQHKRKINTNTVKQKNIEGTYKIPRIRLKDPSLQYNSADD